MPPRNPRTSPSRAANAAIILSIVAAVASNQFTAHAFFVSPSHFSSKHSIRMLTPRAPLTTRTVHPSNRSLRSWKMLRMAATAPDRDVEKEISSMRVKEIRQELESYGVSTKSFFEKREMVEALLKARLEGKTPVDNGVNSNTASTNSGPSSSTNRSTSTANRKERIQQEIEKCKKLKVGELKKELESYGISTKSYFEKSEFVRAAAEARVDGPEKSASSGGAGSTTSSGRVKEEPRDPSYKDVNVSKFDKGLLQGNIIDVRAR